MINQMEQERLSKSTRKSVVVRSFGHFVICRGVGVDQKFIRLDKLLKKKPSAIILHVGTNGSLWKTSKTRLDELLKLKHHIENIKD